MTWRRDGPRFLTESLRIDEEDLASVDWTLLPDIIDGIRSCAPVRTRPD